ncbi:MAG TPA: PSD1 and planctomycete cytochrome C domain-containing protein [Planctomycetaceae bacterium]|jgi:hypothetical protein|nr:PSD1 and planctomycete cytochrome C domain-containing protein [Planctomycetaceae bacterium]
MLFGFKKLVLRVRFNRVLAIILAGLLAAQTVAGAKASDVDEAFFESNIRPVLLSKCLKCHGGEKTSGSLNVASRDSLLKGGESGTAVVPRYPEKSLLIEAIRYKSDNLKMPPDAKMADRIVADFERWVRDGAVWPKKDVRIVTDARAKELHWAFRPVRKTHPPDDPSGWSATPIDRFIRAAMQIHRLKPTVPADKRTLLRRMSFDLIGLPPTLQEVEAFQADESPDATARQAERLLASPLYGERWGRHWMDLVRYADTAGDNADYPVPEAHLYRDYIIQSFNSDKPYDEFVRQQVAGDLLAQRGPSDKYAEGVIATGFLAQSRRYAVMPYEAWHLTLEDTIETVGRTYLAMTLRCARCHDHKVDPIPTRDYYRLYGIFNSTQYPYPGSEFFVIFRLNRKAFVPLLPRAQAAAIVRAFESDVAQTQFEIGKLEKTDPENHVARARLAQLQQRLFDMQRVGSPPALPVAYAACEGNIGDANVHLHGEPDKLGDKVPRGAPHFLPGVDAPSPGPGESGRLQLADWLTSRRNPLTARVMVNRIWQYHFGRGLVETSSYFGLRGSPPTHPELLDWLAASFVEHGWSIKWLHRQILASKVYQLAATADVAREAIDAGDLWLWRFQRQRLDAEAIRDSMLSVSGTLQLGRPKPYPFPDVASWRYTQHHPFIGSDQSHHRSVYLLTHRLRRHPFLGSFDEPDAISGTDVRVSSTVPQQALFLMNSDVMRDIAGTFARRLRQASDDVTTRVDLAHELAFSRRARSDEIEKARAYVERYNVQAIDAGLQPSEAEAQAWVSYARTLLASHEFFYAE